MKKRVISFMFVMVFVCIFSTAGFAYNVDAWAGITGGKNAITCSAHASTNCSKSDLEGSSYEGYIEEDGREFYQMAGGDQVSYDTDWDVKNPSGLYYEIHIWGSFSYKHGIASDPFDEIGTKSFISAKDGESPGAKLEIGFKDALAKAFQIPVNEYTHISCYSEDYTTFQLKNVSEQIGRAVGDTKPVYLMRKDGRTLLVLKQDGQGVNYQFTFSVQDGTYKLENVEQKQGERIDGKDFLTA